MQQKCQFCRIAVTKVPPCCCGHKTVSNDRSSRKNVCFFELQWNRAEGSRNYSCTAPACPSSFALCSSSSRAKYINICTGAATTCSNSLLHIRTVVASAGLSRHTALPFMEAQVDHSCQILLLFPPPLRSSFNFFNCHSWLVLHFSSPSFGQTHRRAKQFPHLHAWGDMVSFKRS